MVNSLSTQRPGSPATTFFVVYLFTEEWCQAEEVLISLSIEGSDFSLCLRVFHLEIILLIQ